MIARTDVVDAVAQVLDDDARCCSPHHVELGRRVADLLADHLAPAPATSPEEPAPAPHSDSPEVDRLDLGVWIDDPPSLVLDGRYLDRLLELELGHVAVMLDGPEPGLSDARWDWRALERLRRRLPDEVEAILTCWISPQARALEELARELPPLVEALEADAVEGDHEPAGHWRESGVRGFRDEDRDGSRLDDAAEAIAQVLCSQPVEAVETTTFPGALRPVVPMLEALVRHAPPGMAVRYFSQDYAVARRGGVPVPWDGPLGPERMARESRAAAHLVLPQRVEVCSGFAAYRTTWPDGRDSIGPAIQTARDAGTRRVRGWSGKWLARMRGHERRRGAVSAYEGL